MSYRAKHESIESETNPKESLRIPKKPKDDNVKYQDESYCESEGGTGKDVPPMVTPIGDASQTTVEAKADPNQLQKRHQ